MKTRVQFLPYEDEKCKISEKPNLPKVKYP
jgi:hypothetical protein